MRKCDDTSDCRDDEGYTCVRGSNFGFNGEATVAGNPNQKFCAARRPAAAPVTPPPVSDADADAGR